MNIAHKHASKIPIRFSAIGDDVDIFHCAVFTRSKRIALRHNPQTPPQIVTSAPTVQRPSISKPETMGDNEQRALSLMAEAEKKMQTPKGFFGSLFGCVFTGVFALIHSACQLLHQWEICVESVSNLFIR